MSSLKLVNLKKSYDEVEVLHGVNLDVEPGEFIVVVGPSGCGKSSLLRMVAGLETVTSGEIFIADRKVNHIEPKARDIAMVFQNYALYPHMTVFHNMAYGLRMRKYPKDEIKKNVLDVAKMLQLSHLLDRKPNELSGGQRQRVAMGRAIVRKPVVFLFDEPLSNLDTQLRHDMRLEIKKLQQRLDITCLYVTHDQTEAMTMADRIVVLNQGYAEQTDTPYDVYHSPKTKFVAGFMGSSVMNFIEASVNEDGIYWQGECRIPLTLEYLKACEVTLAVRAEDINFEQGFKLNYKVGMVETLGADLLVHGAIDGGIPFAIKCRSEKKITTGDELTVYIKEEKIHFFDKVTGRRLENKHG